MSYSSTDLSPRQLMLSGYIAIIPLMIGVAPFGVVFGALAAGAGLSAGQALGMSIFIIAGSSQFVAVTLIDDQAPILIIIFTTFVINLRHFLYSASLSGFLKPISNASKLVIAYLMIDEVYAAVIQRQQNGELSPKEFRWYFIGAGLNLATLWWVTSVIGVGIGNIIPLSTMDVLAFTLPLIFTAIVVPMILTWAKFWAALSACAMGIIFAPLPNSLNLIIAAIIGLIVGVSIEIYTSEEITETQS